MKKLYMIMAGALCAMSAGAAGVVETFSSENGCWTLGQSAVAKWENGHLATDMVEQSNGKFRADISYKMGDTDGFTIDANEHKLIAIKFIGTRPDGNMTLEIDNDGAWMKNANGKDAWTNKPQGTVVTSGGNTIYYYDLTRSPQFAGTVKVTKMNFKIADCVNEPHSYAIDWVKTYADIDAIEADRDWKDDGDNDADEAQVAKLPVENETSGKGFNTLADAIGAAADGDVLVINENQYVGARIGVNNRHITIKGAEADRLILRDEKFSNALMFLVNQSDEVDTEGNKISGHLTFENLIIDGQAVEATQACVEASKNGVVDFKNVKFVNCTSGHNQGLVSMKDGGKVNLENVETFNCHVPDGRGEFFCGTNNLTVAGACKLSVYAEKQYSIGAGEMTGENVVTIYFDEMRDLTEGAVIVRGSEDLTHFRSGINGKNLQVADGNLVLVDDPNYSGVEGVSAEAVEAEAVYYNLQGVKVANPESGLYIVVRGSKISKELVK